MAANRGAQTTPPPHAYEGPRIVAANKLLSFSLSYIFAALLRKQESLQRAILQMISEKKKDRKLYRWRMDGLNETSQDLKELLGGAKELLKEWRESGLDHSQDNYILTSKTLIEDYVELASQVHHNLKNSILVLERGKDEDIQELAGAWKYSEHHLIVNTTALSTSLTVTAAEINRLLHGAEPSAYGRFKSRYMNLRNKIHQMKIQIEGIEVVKKTLNRLSRTTVSMLRSGGTGQNQTASRHR